MMIRDEDTLTHSQVDSSRRHLVSNLRITVLFVQELPSVSEMVWHNKVGGSTWWWLLRLMEIWVCSGERMRPVLWPKPLVGSRLSLPFRCGTVCDVPTDNDDALMAYIRHSITNMFTPEHEHSSASTTSWPTVTNMIACLHLFANLIALAAAIPFEGNYWKYCLQAGILPLNRVNCSVGPLPQLALFIRHHLFSCWTCRPVSMYHNVSLCLCLYGPFGRCHLESIIIKVGTHCWDTLWRALNVSKCLPSSHALLECPEFAIEKV